MAFRVAIGYRTDRGPKTTRLNVVALSKDEAFFEAIRSVVARRGVIAVERGQVVGRPAPVKGF